jgi:hypothetical protein
MTSRFPLGLIVLGALAVVGCGSGSRGSSSKSTTSAASVGSSAQGGTTPITTGGGAITGPGGVAVASGGGGAVGVGGAGTDLTPPTITLTAPSRGTFTGAAQVQVTGTATDASGVATLLVNGTLTRVDPAGAFSATVALTPGVNIIEIQAADPHQNMSDLTVSVTSGTFLPQANVVSKGLAVRFEQPAFDAIARVGAQRIAGTNLQQQVLGQNPLFSGGSGLANAVVNASSVSFGTSSLALTPTPAGLQIQVSIPAIRLVANARGRVLGIRFTGSGTVSAAQATLRATAVVSPSNGGLSSTLQGVRVDLVGFRVNINNLPPVLDSLVARAVRGILERQIQRRVEQVLPPIVNTGLAGAPGALTQTVFGRQLTIRQIPRSVQFDAMGATIVSDADVTLNGAPRPGLPTTPGSLTTPGPVPVAGVGRALHLSLNDDLLNRLGHAAWRGGLLHQRVDQAFVAQNPGLPAWLQLDVFSLETAFPVLVGRWNSSDPVEVSIEALTPPVFTPSAQGTLAVTLGDLMLSVRVLPPGGTPELVFETALQVEFDMTVTLSTNHTLQLGLMSQPKVRTDLVQSPIAPLPEFAIQTLVDLVTPPMAQFMVGALSGIPLPTYPGLTLRKVDTVRDGAAGDFLTFRGDL